MQYLNVDRSSCSYAYASSFSLDIVKTKTTKTTCITNITTNITIKKRTVFRYSQINTRVVYKSATVVVRPIITTTVLAVLGKLIRKKIMVLSIKYRRHCCVHYLASTKIGVLIHCKYVNWSLHFASYLSYLRNHHEIMRIGGRATFITTALQNWNQALLNRFGASTLPQSSMVVTDNVASNSISFTGSVHHHVLSVWNILRHPDRPDFDTTITPYESEYRTSSRIRVSNPLTAQEDLCTRAGTTFMGSRREGLSTNVHRLRSNVVKPRSFQRIQLGHRECLQSGNAHINRCSRFRSRLRIGNRNPFNASYEANMDHLRAGNGPVDTVTRTVFNERTQTDRTSLFPSIAARYANLSNYYRQLRAQHPALNITRFWNHINNHVHVAARTEVGEPTTAGVVCDSISRIPGNSYSFLRRCGVAIWEGLATAGEYFGIGRRTLLSTWYWQKNAVMLSTKTCGL